MSAASRSISSSREKLAAVHEQGRSLPRFVMSELEPRKSRQREIVPTEPALVS